MKRFVKKIIDDKVLYLMLLPALIYFSIFHIWPILGMKLAFYDYRIIGDNVFAGFKYFRELFSTPLFSQIIQNTLIISAMKLFLIFPLPIVYAILLNEIRNKHFRWSVQVTSYLAHFFSWVVIAGIWYEILSPSKGFVNEILKVFGFLPRDFLTDKSSIRWILVASEAWRNIGWESIIFFSAIMSINSEIFEAAFIDGANRRQIIKNIIIPALILPSMTVLILNMGFIMNAGRDQILNFTNDAVMSRIDVIDTYVYRIGLISLQYSLATAANLFKGIIGVILTLLTHFISKKLTGEGAW